MWILKNSKELLENLKSRCFSKIDSIKTYGSPHFIQQFLTTNLNLGFKQKGHPEIQISSDWETRCIFCETPP
jgi:hypothetical protein